MFYSEIEKIVIKDFDQFKGADSVIPYRREKYINFATQMTMQKYNETYCSQTELEDFVHGLTHIFFDGILEGMRIVLQATQEGE